MGNQVGSTCNHKDCNHVWKFRDLVAERRSLRKRLRPDLDRDMGLDTPADLAKVDRCMESGENALILKRGNARQAGRFSNTQFARQLSVAQAGIELKTLHYYAIDFIHLLTPKPNSELNSLMLTYHRI